MDFIAFQMKRVCPTHDPGPHGGFNGTPKVYKWNSDVSHRAVAGLKHNTVEVYSWDPVEIDGGEAGQFMM